MWILSADERWLREGVAERLHVSTGCPHYATSQSPFAPGSVTPGRWTRRAPGTERWVAAQLVAEVRFAEWTPDGRIRHSVFHGLRDDKPAAVITKEEPVPAGAVAKKAATRKSA